MLISDFGDRQWRLEFLKNTEPDDAVRLDQGVLRVGQSPRLTQYLCRHRHLADVVHDGGQTKNLESLFGQAELRTNGDGQTRHTLLVLDRERIAIPLGGGKRRDALID